MQAVNSQQSVVDVPVGLDTKWVVANFVVFQIAWFTCIGSVARNLSSLGLAVIAIAVGIHLISVRNRANALSLAAANLLIGIIIESILAMTHATQFDHSALAIGSAPLWMIAMWALFSTTLNVSMRWLRGRYVLATVLGAVAGPLSYLAGSKMGALSLPLDYSLLIIGTCWAAAMPLLLLSAKKWDAMA
ncbi:MAG TPA: DUF2878 domain-containing protein [Steroidobacteraceae bacterium]|nr:DUF2878 domain-containing protein [Steroidobacteraceae bacterium]